MSVLRIPPKADPDTRACFQDVEQRLTDLEARAVGASTSDLMTVRDDLLKLQGDIAGQLNGLKLYASQVISLVSGGLHANNVQTAINELDFRTGLPYDTQPEYFWPFPGCYLTKAADWTHNSQSNWLTVPFDTANQDNNSMADLASNRIVVKTSGMYLIWMQGYVSTTNGTRAMQVMINGVTSYLFQYFPTSQFASTTGMRRLIKGDLITMQMYQDVSASYNVVCASPYTSFGVQWIRL